MKPQSKSYKFAYYCSGHGFGHATRVIAISLELISSGHQVYIITSTPKSVFESNLSNQLIYRPKIIEPKIIQPKAYDVDKYETFENLNKFIKFDRSRILNEEIDWLKSEGIQCVLVDAPFVPCAAAFEAGIPSVIISNFTFCSCYSYLSMPNSSSDPSIKSEEVQDPIDPDLLDPLVKVVISDYSKAKLLLRLPGSIPIPGFDTDVELPSTKWVDLPNHSFQDHIHNLLNRSTEEIPRPVKDLPLVFRKISKEIYKPNQKLKLLKLLNVPVSLQTLDTKILLISFGGQVIPRPKPIQSQESVNSPFFNILPPGWVAIVCGSSVDGLTSRDALDRVYPIPKTFSYVPDLTALSDVVLGKLGYGTCSETLATMTPFIYVPRPMFIEEYGLKRLIKNLTNVEMSRNEFEEGKWKEKISKADLLGSKLKREFIENQIEKDENGIEGIQSTQIVVNEIETFLTSLENNDDGNKNGLNGGGTCDGLNGGDLIWKEKVKLDCNHHDLSDLSC